MADSIRYHKRYTQQEDELLKQVYGHTACKQFLHLFPGRTTNGLNNRAIALGLRFQPVLSETSFVPTQIEVAYLSGHFDGEGCIQMRLQKENKTPRIAISVTNAYVPVLEFYKRYFGGKVTPHGRGTNKPLFSWRISGLLDCQRFLVAVTPMLMEKREQAAIALKWIEFRLTKPYRGVKWHDDSLLTSETYQALKAMKQSALQESEQAALVAA